MAGTEVITDIDSKKDKKSVAEEKKRLKAEKKEQKKEAKRRAKELSLQEAELDEDEVGGGIPVFLVTGMIVVVWIAILCLLVKLDVGGFGSGVLAPILKDVPVLSKILPSSEETPVSPDTEGEAVAENGSTEEEAYGGYTDLKEAVNYIKELELELQRAQSTGAANSEELESLKAEVARLKTFEDNQVEFQRIKTEFYEEVIYAENGPGPEAYKKYFESMDPATAEYLYKQVVQQVEESADVKEYAKAYSEMKPKAAAAIIEAMTDNLGLASRILSVMSAEDRGKILEAMDPQVAARITKIMDPES